MPRWQAASLSSLSLNGTVLLQLLQRYYEYFSRPLTQVCGLHVLPCLAMSVRRTAVPIGGTWHSTKTTTTLSCPWSVQRSQRARPSQPTLREREPRRIQIEHGGARVATKRSGMNTVEENKSRERKKSVLVASIDMT